MGNEGEMAAGRVRVMLPVVVVQDAVLGNRRRKGTTRQTKKSLLLWRHDAIAVGLAEGVVVVLVLVGASMRDDALARQPIISQEKRILAPRVERRRQQYSCSIHAV